MSQITRCPACHTVFRVVQDQLRMSDGWVRCGKCTEVFDAKASLTASVTELTSIETAMQVQARAEGFVPPLAGDGAIEKPEHGPVEPVLLPDRLSTDGQTSVHDGDDRVVQSLVSPPADAAQHEPEVAKAMEGPSTVPVEVPARPGSLGEAAPDVSFMRPMPGASPPQSGLRRFLMAMLAVALLAVLAVQVAVLERDRLAAMFPQLKPALLGMCEQLGCSVSSLRQIESVVIDSSSFNRARGDTYRLNLALRNTASVDVALPSVELTLTDSQDQALIRRVLSANELAKPGSTDGVLAAGAEWQGQATMTVRLAANAERFTGYRVLMFYP